MRRLISTLLVEHGAEDPALRLASRHCCVPTRANTSSDSFWQVPHDQPRPRSGVGFTPFVIGNPDDGKTALVPHPYEEDFSKDNNLTRTDKNRLPGLTCCHLKNPNLFLSDALVNQTVLSATVLRLTSDTSAADSVPDVGGGTANIASLTGKGSVPTGGPNAAAPVVSATFWIEQVRDQHGAGVCAAAVLTTCAVAFRRRELAPHHSRDT